MKKFIKNTFMLCVAIATLGLTSCTKDLDENIIGKWTVTNMTATVNVMGQITMDFTEGFETIEFFENGTCNMIIHELDEFIGMGQPTFGDATTTETMNYTINDETLIFNLDGEMMTFTIEDMSKNEIIFTGTQTIPDDEYPMDINIDFSIKRV